MAIIIKKSEIEILLKISGEIWEKGKIPSLSLSKVFYDLKNKLEKALLTQSLDLEEEEKLILLVMLQSEINNYATEREQLLKIKKRLEVLT